MMSLTSCVDQLPGHSPSPRANAGLHSMVCIIHMCGIVFHFKETESIDRVVLRYKTTNQVAGCVLPAWDKNARIAMANVHIPQYL